MTQINLLAVSVGNTRTRVGAFAKGVVDLRDVLYFLSVTAVAVAASTHALKSRHWR